MFSERSRKIAISVMDELMSHPIAHPFMHSNTIHLDGYFDSIPSRDLTSIRTKLESGGYATPSEWIDSMTAIWSDTDSVNSPMKVIAAGEVQRLFGKMMKRFQRKPIKDWCSHLMKHRDTVTDMLSDPPEGVRLFMEKHSNLRILKSRPPVVTDRELANFMQAMQMITSNDDHREMIKIITTLEPDVETGQIEFVVDATALKRSTIEDLKAYMIGALAKQGLAYPE